MLGKPTRKEEVICTDDIHINKKNKIESFFTLDSLELFVYIPALSGFE